MPERDTYWTMSDKDFPAKYRAQTDEERKHADEQSMKLIEKEALEKPQAFFYMYLLSRYPERAHYVKDSLDKYEAWNQNSKFQGMGKYIPLARKGMRSPLLAADLTLTGLGTMVKVIGDAYHIDKAKWRNVLMENPEFRRSAAQMVHKSRIQQRLSVDPSGTISQPGSFQQISNVKKLFDRIQNSFDASSDAYTSSAFPLPAESQMLSDLEKSFRGLSPENQRKFLEDKDLSEEERYAMLGLTKEELPKIMQAAFGTMLDDQQAMEAAAAEAARIAAIDEELLTPEERLQRRENALKDDLTELINKPGTTEAKAERYRQKIKDIDINRLHREHGRQMGQISAKVQGTTEILSLIDPKLASELSQGANALMQIYNGAKTMEINGAMDIASMGSVAGGIKLAMMVMGPKKKGPSADEVIMKMLGQVLENQKRMLEKLDKIDGKIDRMQGDLDYMIGFLGQNFDQVKDGIMDISREVDSVNQKIGALAHSNQRLAADRILISAGASNDVFADVFENPHSDYHPHIERYKKDPNQLHDLLHEEYIRLSRHLSTLVSYATNQRTVNLDTFKITRDFVAIPPHELEGEYAELSPEWRAGLLPSISRWVEDKIRHIPKEIRPNIAMEIDKNKFDDIGQPALFTEVFVPQYAEAARWYVDHNSKFLETHKLRLSAHLFKIIAASAESRKALPMALAVYQENAEIMHHHMDKYFDGSHIATVIREHLLPRAGDYKIPLKPNEEGKLSDVDWIEVNLSRKKITEMVGSLKQHDLIVLGQKMGLITVQAHIDYQGISRPLVIRPRKPKRMPHADQVTARADAVRSKHIQSSKVKGIGFRFRNTKRGYDYVQATAEGKRYGGSLPFGNSAKCCDWNIVPMPEDMKVNTKNTAIVYDTESPVAAMRDKSYYWKGAKGYKPAYRRGVDLKKGVRNALEALIVKAIAAQLKNVVKGWSSHLKKHPGLEALTFDLARSRYAVKSFIMAGYGNSDGSSPEFNKLYHMHRSLPAIFQEGGLTDLTDVADLQHALAQLPASEEVVQPDEMPEFPEANDVHNSDYGFSGIQNSKKLLAELPGL